MTSTFRGLLILVGSILAGCAPLKQAPLVYSSKVAVGLDVSATSTETPGVGVTIGYKQIDAAYVPVAVARECEDPKEANCLNMTYGILALSGDNSNSNGMRATEGQIDRAATEMDEAINSLTQARTRLLEATNRNKTAITAEAQAREDYAKISTNPPESEDDKYNRRKPLDAAIAQVKSSADDLANAQNAVDAASKANIAATQKYQDLVDSAKNQTSNGKKDAFSVFGSFSSKSEAKGDVTAKAGASLSLGKIFSTGVASQHLTEGVREYFSAVAPSSCFEHGLKLLASVPEEAKKDAAAKIVAVCGQVTL